MPIIEIYRVKVEPANVERMLEIHEAAVAEYQEQVPELLGAELGHDRGELVHSAGSAWATAR
jgi:hypothetical protein